MDVDENAMKSRKCAKAVPKARGKKEGRKKGKARRELARLVLMSIADERDKLSRKVRWLDREPNERVHRLRTWKTRGGGRLGACSRARGSGIGSEAWWCSMSCQWSGVKVLNWWGSRCSSLRCSMRRSRSLPGLPRRVLRGAKMMSLVNRRRGPDMTYERRSWGKCSGTNFLPSHRLRKSH